MDLHPRTPKLLLPGIAIVLALASLGVSFGAGAFGSDPAPPRPAAMIRVEVGNEPGDAVIPAGFVGLSTEYSSLFAYAGDNPRAVNPLFVRLIQNLAPGGSPVIRIGGDSTDWTWWPTPGSPRPVWAKYVLTPRWIAVLRAVALAAGARVIPGINFEADSPQVAGSEARALLNGVGRGAISAFELGNEPEVYNEIGWYRGAGGRPVLGRPASYGMPSFLADFRAISAALPRNVPVAGPALALTWRLSIAGRYLAAEPAVRVFTFHFYPLKRCYNAQSSPTYPTLAHLMSLRAGGPPAGTGAAVATAHARGVAVRVDEFNSVSCRGRPGLSDRFASALWVVDALFRLARAGVDGVNLHTLPGVAYEPFAFTRAHGRWQAQVKPIYYGLLLFSRSAPAGARLLPTLVGGDRALRVWATRDPRGVVRVVLINDSADRAVTVAVGTRMGAVTGNLERLSAPGLLAPSGMTLAGQSFGAATATGELAGGRQSIRVQPAGGRYVVKLTGASAALLTLTPG